MGLIRWTPTASRDLSDIWDYVARDSPDAADALLRTIESKIDLLSEFPNAGRDRSELRRRLRSFPVGNYVLYYRPARGGIEMLRVIHGARDVRHIFKRKRR